MRTTFLALASIAAVAACNPATQGSDAAKQDTAQQGGGPSLSAAAYRVEATMIDPSSGRTARIVQYRSGDSVRLETAGMVTILNGVTREAFTIAEMGGQRMAMRVPFDTVNFAAQEWQVDVASLTRVGPCSVAGATGSEWAKMEPDGSRSLGCLTSDGILLRATHGGRTVWETTSLRRGAQDPALFTLPPGVQPMDMGSMGGMMRP